jgi:ABC-type Zn uptake system ZnuABC Zn-binding protein ZnuA
MLSRRAFLASSSTGVLAAGLAGCGKYVDPWEHLPGPPRVVVSFPPLYCFVKNVAAERAGIISLCTTTGPHHYAANVRDELYLRRADLFFTNGLGLDENFTEPIVRQHRRVRHVALADRLPHDLMLHNDPDHKHVHADGTVCEHGEHDPHVWLGIPQTIRMVEMIRDELQKVDPGAGPEYHGRAAAFIEQIRALHAYGRQLLADKNDRRLVQFHESLGYFADEDSFHLDIVGVISESPGDEPTSPRLAELVRLCKEKGVRVIAVEPQYPKTTSAHVLQNELKRHGCSVALVEIDPLETATPEELEDANWYIRKMKENLDRLAPHLS